MRTPFASRLPQKLWDGGTSPTIRTLRGRWWVLMLTGLDMSGLGHRKFMWDSGWGTRGHNVVDLAGERVWGVFDAGYEEGEVVLRYHKHGIVDQIRQVNEILIIGKFYWRRIFLGYFLMFKECDADGQSRGSEDRQDGS